MLPTAELKKPERHFLPEGFEITDWKNLEPWFQDLEQTAAGHACGPREVVAGHERAGSRGE